MIRLFTLASVASIASTIATAQESDNAVEFLFGLGPSFQTGYFGDEDIEFGFSPRFQLERWRLGNVSFGGVDSDFGLRIGGSFRFVSGRDASEFDELDGLNDVDPSIELGGGLEFIAPDYELFAMLRYGLIGHEAFVGELGGDLFYRPTDQLTFSAGPRLLFGDDDYASTYFGVSAGEANESRFDVFDADGGFVGAGAHAQINYQLNGNWEVIGTLEYEKLQNDAADSPITDSDDVVSGSLVLTRRIVLRF